ncbi:hypothetical protein [Micromonospora sp. S4605]|uniref:hypothetical protein n=1 Tax=Micromonospora sp. S4605 TaxID=1420897 RepID=UPI001E436742|nr:hypothetical protein [Micromonospora sp. S4605]
MAVRLDAHDQIVVCAPHGLDDLLDGCSGATRTGSARRSPGNDSPDTAAPPNAGPASASCHEPALDAREGMPPTSLLPAGDSREGERAAHHDLG